MLPLHVVLGDVAAPLLDLGRFGSDHALQLAAAIWNIARLPSSCPRETLLVAVATSADSKVDEALSVAIYGAYRRAMLVYGDDLRVVDALPA